MKSSRTILAVLASLIGLVLALPATFILSIFGLFAFFVRTAGRVMEPTSIPWQAVIQFDPNLGWKPKPGLDVHCLAHFDDLFKLHTDREGWPGSTTLDESDLVVLGDSFAFGYGMDTTSCFFEINPHLTVKPLGAPGYSMVQPLLLLHQLRYQLQNKLLVWCVYLGNDLYDNLMPNFLHYRAPFVRPVDGTNRWEVVTEHINKSDWSFSTQPRPYYTILAKLCCREEFSDRVYAGCEFILKTGHQICEEAGAKLIVLTIPGFKQLNAEGLAFLSSMIPKEQSMDPDYPDQRISEICSKYGIDFVAGKELLDVSDYKRGEQVHWNKLGHKKIANLILNLYQDYNSKAGTRFLAQRRYQRRGLKTTLDNRSRDKGEAVQLQS